MATRLPPSSTSSKDNDSKKIRILIVDDEYDVTITLKTILEQQEEENNNNNKTKEFEVDVFTDPEMALSNFKAGKYDLLLLDIVMPKMNGFELYEKMKNIDNKVKVCFITAYNINYDAIRDLFPTIADVDCFIRKPVEQKELKNRIREELRRSP